MATLEFIKNQKNALKEKNIIDFTEINGEIIEYNINISLILQNEENEKKMQKELLDNLKKSLLKKGKKITSENTNEIIMEFLDTYGEDVSNDLIEKKEIKLGEEFLKNFEKAPTIEEIKKYINNEIGEEFGEKSYNLFIKQIHKEFQDLLKKYLELNIEKTGK